MRTAAFGVALAVSAVIAGSAQRPARDQPAARSYWLDDLTWSDAEQILGPETVVVLPVGAAALEHGHHLKLRTDATITDHVTRRVAAATPVVVAPALTYHHYPGFDEYPGTTSLSLETARNVTVDVVRSLARSGPRRFYVLSTAAWNKAALSASAETFNREGILLRYTDVSTHLDPIARTIQQQEGGGHADEIETSMVLYVDKTQVDMPKAEKTFAPASVPFALTRRANAPGTYSASGVWGDPTVATAEKGRLFIDALLAGVLSDIAALRALVPQAVPGSPRDEPAAPAGRPAPRPQPADRCSAGDERTIRGIGDAFTSHWRNADAEQFAALWTEEGDIGHPDGLVERTARNILINRFELFRRREYRHSRHPLQIGVIRCLSNEIAVTDGKWELRDVTDADGKILPAVKGLCTLVVKRTSGAWRIEAYRYTIDAPSGPLPPTLLKRPGYPGRGGR